MVSVGVTAGTTCGWTATSNAEWIAITSGSSGTGSGSFTFAVPTNPSSSPRTGTVTVAGQSVTVTQDGVPCSFSLSTSSVALTSSAGAGAVAVTAGSTCGWTATSNTGWIAVTGGSTGTGDGAVAFSVTANPSTSPRTGTLTVAGQTVTVTQAGAPCSFTLSTTSASFTATDGSGAVAVSAGSTCDWAATSNAEWVTVTSGPTGTGDGTVTFSVTANPSTSPRTGTLTVAGQTVTVTQAGAVCTYTLAAPSQTFASTGGTGSVTVNASLASCSWAASSDATWLTVTSGSSGTGTGTVSFSADANTTSTSRTASISIADQSYTVTVAAGSSVQQTVSVATESELQAAVTSATGNTRIVVAAGTYTLSRTLSLPTGVKDVTITGATGNAADVVLVGQGMNNASYGNVPDGIVALGIQRLTLSNLTIREVYGHAVRLDPTASAPHLSNLRLLNAGQAFVLSTSDSTLGAVDDGIVESSWFERTTPSRDAVTTAIEVHGGARWQIRHNVFRNLVAPSGQVGSPAVLMTDGARDTVTEKNKFIGCQRGVAYGWVDRQGSDHSGGIVRNNFFYRSSSQSGEASIMLVDSPLTEVLHNTILTSGTYATPIEYRYPETTGVVIRNNLLDGSVWARDGALGDDTANDGTARPEYFVDAATGDLHLAPGSPAIDRASLMPDVVVDLDDEPRPRGAAADMGADEAEPPNQLPTVSLTSPTSGSYTSPLRLQLSATASDEDGSIAAVEFYVNSVLVGRVTSGPYTVTFSSKSAGTFQIVAVAIDNDGGRTTSALVEVSTVRKGKK